MRDIYTVSTVLCQGDLRNTRVKRRKDRRYSKIFHIFPYIAKTEFNLRTWPLGHPGPEPERHHDGMKIVGQSRLLQGSRRQGQWTRIISRLVNPNCYEPEARPDGGLLQFRLACGSLGSSLLPTYPRSGSVADPLPDQHDGMDVNPIADRPHSRSSRRPAPATTDGCLAPGSRAIVTGIRPSPPGRTDKS